MSKATLSLHLKILNEPFSFDELVLTIFSNFPWENSIDSLTGVYFRTVLSASSERFCQRTKYYCDDQPFGVSFF